MSATVNCPQCDAPLELPDDIPAGKRLQCPDCGTAFSPGKSESSRSVTRSRARRHDDDELPARRNKGGSLAIIAAIVVIVLMGIGIAGAIVWVYLDDRRAREEAANALPPNKPVADRGRPAGGPPGQGGMMPQGGMQGGMPGGPPVGVRGGPPVGGPQPVVLKVGDAAPEIDGEDLDGKPMKLSDFRGKVVVLDFWGEWCAPCRAGYDYQNNLVKRMKDEPFVLLGVNCDTTKEEAKAAMKTHKLDWRAWQDSGGPAMTGPIYLRYGVTAVPRTLIIDKQGIIRQQFIGQAGDVAIDGAVDKVLAQDENRPADAPARWRPGSTGFSQLGDEVMLNRWLIRPPAGYTAEPVAPTVVQETHRWKGPQRPDGTAPVFEVRITRAQPATKLEDVLEKDMQAIPSGRVGWSCAAPTRGEVNGVVFARVRWSIMESLNPLKYKKTGYLYAAVDGNALILISHQDSLSNFNPGADTAPLTFHKAK